MRGEADTGKSYWTKSLRDSLELAELVMLRGMCWCAALDRRREVQGDRTILTRLLILSHSAFSAASTTTPHERRRAQVRAPKPVWANRAMTLFAPVCTYVDRVRSGKVLQYQ